MTAQNTKVKICGIKTPEALSIAKKSGADFAGFVFFEKSPRNITVDEAARLVPTTQLTAVGLFVDPDDDLIRRVLARVPLKMLQLHGNETPARVAALKSMTGLPVMKAIRIATRDDLETVAAYASIVDWLLFDAKVEGESLPGGTGRNFDWTLLEGFKSPKPWMLAGGLTPENVAGALQKLKPDAVDVSSGVESAPGVKDAGKITSFIDNVRHA